MALKAGNLAVFADAAHKASTAITTAAVTATQGADNIAANQELSPSAIAEIEAAEEAKLADLSVADQAVKVVKELFKTATPLVYLNKDKESADLGKYMKVSDDTVAFDPATLP